MGSRSTRPAADAARGDVVSLRMGLVAMGMFLVKMAIHRQAARHDDGLRSRSEVERQLTGMRAIVRTHILPLPKAVAVVCVDKHALQSTAGHRPSFPLKKSKVTSAERTTKW